MYFSIRQKLTRCIEAHKAQIKRYIKRANSRYTQCVTEKKLNQLIFSALLFTHIFKWSVDIVSRLYGAVFHFFNFGEFKAVDYFWKRDEDEVNERRMSSDDKKSDIANNCFLCCNTEHVNISSQRIISTDIVYCVRHMIWYNVVHPSLLRVFATSSGELVMFSKCEKD